MSRRPADKAAQNQQVIKNLLKLEANKNCADCKRNKHPRWASWNLGVFVCIRCSGIHRGMGTHISRVKSVDLDAWTDEQLQSIMKWGNARANRYWESKLAPGHVPSDGKIENFIRTKYESKRWVMDGPLPDPSTLGGDGDEDVPLTTVQERARLDRSSSQRVASTQSQPAARSITRAPAAPQPASFNLIDGGDDLVVPPRANTTEPNTAGRPPPPKASTQPSQLLKGLDFLDGPPQRPSSTSSSGPSSMSRPDLKQSILSLYASKPAAQAPSQTPASHSRQTSTVTSPTAVGGGGGAFGGLDDAFGSLTFGSSGTSNPKAPTPQAMPQKSNLASGPKAQPAKPDAYAALTGVLSSPQTSTSAMSPPPFSGGSFFDSGPKSQAKPTPASIKSSYASTLTTQTSTDDWGDFSAATGSASPTQAPKPASQPKPSALLDFTSGAAANFSAPTPAATQQRGNGADSSVFNLSSKATQSSAPASKSGASQAFPSDPWGANEWNTADTTSAAIPQASPSTSKQTLGSSNDFGWTAPADWGSSNVEASASQNAVKSPAFDTGGWGDPAPSSSGGLSGFGQTSTAPKVQQEEDFGGWGVEATPARPAPPRQQSQGQNSGASAPAANDDLFANVWG